MNRPLFAVLAAVCFAGGWWVDSLARAKTVETKTEAREVKPDGGTAGSAGGTEKIRTQVLRGIHTAEDLVTLAIPGRRFATRAQLDRGAAGMTAEELAKGAEALLTTNNTEALYSVVERWLKTDPLPAVEFACAHANPVLRGLHDEVIDAMAKVFQEALPVIIRVMAKVEGREFYIYARHACIMELKGMEPKAALEIIVNFDAQTRNEWHGAETLGDFPRLWVERDAPAALTWALAQAPGFTRSRILGQMAGAWTSRDPAAAKAFLSNVPAETLPADIRARLTNDPEARRGGAPAQPSPRR